MGRQALLSLILIAACATAAPRTAQAQSPSVSLKAGRLSDALREVSLRTGTPLLFAPDIVGDLRNERLSGPGDATQLLSRLLAGSGLTWRRLANGAVVILRAEPEQPTALPEILVVGRRTQNADIRRSENDFQAYRVATSEDIRAAQVDDLDAFLRTRNPNNIARLGASADNRSRVDLNGLGLNETLVLVDGARMAGLPPWLQVPDITQPDVNGLPLMAIERIESLTGTAGGIYGPGATGGVVNVILRRDYRGAEVSATYGLSGRGDAVRRRLDTRLGFSPDQGRTDVMVNVSHLSSEGLRDGDRDFSERARQLRIARDPLAYAKSSPVIDGVLIRSLDGSPLVLSPALGGAALRSSFTYLPLGGPGADAATLLAGAGLAPSALPSDGNGRARSLLSDVQVRSVLLNVRRRLGGRLEVFGDFIGIQNNARSVSGYLASGQVAGVAALGERNSGAGTGDTYPFVQTTVLTFPLPGFDTVTRQGLRVSRLSVGALVTLPRQWRADLNFGDSVARTTMTTDGFRLENFSTVFSPSGLDTRGRATPNPFGPWDVFLAALQDYKTPRSSEQMAKTRLHDFNLKLAGGLAKTAAGPVALSIQAGHRTERVFVTPVLYGPSTSTSSNLRFSRAVSSLYGELRAPLLAAEAAGPGTPAIDLQLAARRDEIRSTIPQNALVLRAQPSRRIVQGATTYTAGLKASRPGWLARASIATGVLPPLLDLMQASDFTYNIPPGIGFVLAADPARGGRSIGTEKPVVIMGRGSPGLRPEHARTLAAGLVFNPEGRAGPRLALDVTHIEKRGEVSIAHVGDHAYYLANERLYPDRVVRDPLSAEDAAAGFTGGVVTQINAGLSNLGRTTVDIVDLSFDHGVRLRRSDRLKLYATLTWTPRFAKRVAPDIAETDLVSTDGAALKWRGNAGVVWEADALSLGLHAQYYHRYYSVGSIASAAEKRAAQAPGLRIPAQLYLDASAAWRVDRRDKGPMQDLEVRLGINNLLDRDPPVASNTANGFSRDGDPRGRRAELRLTARF